jgi:hypothetical protein
MARRRAILSRDSTADARFAAARIERGRSEGAAIVRRASRKQRRDGPPDRLKDAIITVGDGRGFLVAHASWPHRVITAAHCLPRLPPAHPSIKPHYFNLLGPLDQPPSVPAQCVFADPVGIRPTNPVAKA